RQRQHQTQFRVFLQYWNDVLSKQLPDQHQPHHGPVFVPVADQKRAIVLEMRKRRHQLSFGSAFESEAKRPAGFQNLLNHFVKLIHFDRIDADVRILVLRFFDCPSKGVVQFADAGPQEILKTDEQRKLNSLLLQILRNTENVDPDRISQNWPDRKMPLLVDVEIGLAPQLNPIQVFGVLNRPDFFFSRYVSGHRQNCRLEQKGMHPQ